ncbi:hypothetical protein BCR44DRAFT_1176386 [Catenaria anguillulae PL171]|uniref:Uncharacterized protein n=1 Tax=Catenaria anguillulae PL171 TaxID=765915 RepID=A0A1Y2I1F3_9FUNG|nr:hypothetical protein BCR44DRAFT_1176386 [Catenaria anguillulae PL171]
MTCLDKTKRACWPQRFGAHAQGHCARHDSFINRYLTTGVTNTIGAGARNFEGVTKSGSTVPVSIAITKSPSTGQSSSRVSWSAFSHLLGRCLWTRQASLPTAMRICWRFSGKSARILLEKVRRYSCQNRIAHSMTCLSHDTNGPAKELPFRAQVGNWFPLSTATGPCSPSTFPFDHWSKAQCLSRRAEPRVIGQPFGGSRMTSNKSSSKRNPL